MSTTVARPSWEEVMCVLDELREYTGLTCEDLAGAIGKDPCQGLRGWSEAEYSQLRDLARFTEVFRAFKPNSEVARSWFGTANSQLHGSAPKDVVLGGCHQSLVDLTDLMQAFLESDARSSALLL